MDCSVCKLLPIVNQFAAEKFDTWFNSLKKLDEDCNEDALAEFAVDSYRDDFVQHLFNSWDEGGENFYQEYTHKLMTYKIPDFISLWNETEKWFKEEYSVEIKMKNEEHAWNCIAHFVFSKWVDKFMEEDFIREYTKMYYSQKDYRTRKSRIACGVCLENKIIYTGCSCCNGNFICYSCYLNVDNKCPFCRCEKMIDDIVYKHDVSYHNNATFYDDLEDWNIKMNKVLNEIKKE